MPTKRRQPTWRAVKKKIDEGRGQGEGSGYRPWYYVYEVPSSGRSHVVQGLKENRTCHLLSDIEYHAWLVAQVSPRVIETREQFVLLPVEETVEIAAQIDVKHPTFPGTRTISPLTTDLLLTVRHDQQVTYEAVAIKPSGELAKNRVLEKLEIEHIYWSRRKIDWYVATEREFSKPLIINLKKLYLHLNLSDRNLTEDVVQTVANTLTQEIGNHKGALTQLTNQLDDQMQLERGASLAVAYHLIATGKWVVDLQKPIQPNKHLKILKIDMR